MAAKEPVLPMRVCEKTGHVLEERFDTRKGKRFHIRSCLFCNFTRVKKIGEEE